MSALPPRVLFVSPCAFNRVTGGGITFSNLFKGWPKDRLATIHKDSVPTSTDVCTAYYRLNRLELTPSWPFSGGILNHGRLSSRLKQWIKDFSPDVIYTILGTAGYADLVSDIHKHFGIPVVIHLMDEGATDPQVSGVLGAGVRKRYGKILRSSLSSAKARIGICPTMSSAYERRYNVPFETFMNTIDLQHQAPRSPGPSGDPIRLMYTGSVLSYAQEQSLRDISQVVRELQKSGTRIQLEIYTSLPLLSPSAKDMISPPSVFLHDAIEDDTVYFQTLKQADILVLPANFDTPSIQYIRYSMPTKIPSYLSTGTPILLYGPSEVAQVEYAEKEKWGLVVNRRDPEVLKQAILSLAHNVTLRETLSRQAVSTVRRFHDSTLVREKFRDLLVRSASRG